MDVLQCRPTFYDLEYEINPWMQISNQPDPRLALEQWEGLYTELQKVSRVSLVDPVKNLPDMVFTANAGIVRTLQGKKIAVLSRFRFPERAGEEPYFESWFKANGYQVVRTQNVFEGEGDALFVNDTLCLGYPKRSDIGAHAELGKLLDCDTLSLELVDDRFYHLDTCFLPLQNNTVFYVPEAFSESSRKLITTRFQAIPVKLDEAVFFACNTVVVGDTIITPSGSDTIVQEAKARGFDCKSLPMSEFIKAGGACKCLTLILSR